MNSALGAAFSNDCIVVGHVSLNKKRAKKNLQKIAHGADSSIAAKRVSVTPKASTTPAPVAFRAAEPKAIQAKAIQVPRKALAPVVTEVLPTCFAQLPDGILGAIFSDLSSVGSCAAVCRDLRRTVWDCDGFWHTMRGMVAPSPAREAFRLARFGLEGDWVSTFADFARTASPVSVLEEAVRVAGGLMAPERRSSSVFIALVCDATRRCDASDTVWALLDSLGLKVAVREGAVFAASALDELGVAREDLLEKGILARLDAQVDDMDAFDPFEQVELAPQEEWVVDGPLPALIFGAGEVSEPEPAKACESDADRSTDDESDDEEYYSVCDDEHVEYASKHDALLQDDFLDLLR